jgi:hypothetical protein
MRFYPYTAPTLRQEFNQAKLVLYGTLANARMKPGGDFGEGTTDLHIEAIVKDHPILNGRKVLSLPRYVPDAQKASPKYLVFCDVVKGQIDPYRGFQVKSTELIDYVQGALAFDHTERPNLLYYFLYLEHGDPDVAEDAFLEFRRTDYKRLRLITHCLPADPIAKWLQDRNTPSRRLGLYAFLLGHCGSAERHAEVLRKVASHRDAFSAREGVLIGLTLLDPKGGWDHTRGLLADASSTFWTRYSALRAARFFWEDHPGVVARTELLKGVLPLLDQGDIADLAIEDLRKWHRWEMIDRVLDLWGKKSHDIPVIRRSIMRFALSAEGRNPRAAEFVKVMRKKDPDWVEDVEELLKLETTPPAK